jgi:dATP/dGTP diphosphohydrolase, N-terminal
MSGKYLTAQEALDFLNREQAPQLGLPDEYDARKALPIFDGVIMYFPDAIAAVSEVSVAGNEQHNPGEELHWARGKSMDQFNTAVRHMIDHKRGRVFDIEKSGKRTRHLAKAAWRILAALQLSIEQEHDTRRQSKDGCGPAPEAAQGLLLEAGTERHGSPRARLSRRTPRARVRHRNKGTG